QGIDSERQSTLAGGLGERGDPTGVLVATAVEDHSGDPGVLGSLGDELPDLDRLVGLGALAVPQVRLQRGSRRQGVPLGVVDELDHDVLGRAENSQARALGGSADPLPSPVVPAQTRGRTLGGPLTAHGTSHAYLPAFPALRRRYSRSEE